MNSHKPKPFVKSLRKTRPWHRYFGVLIALFAILSSITGILLSWKKNVQWLQPHDKHAIPIQPDSLWLPIHDLKKVAESALHEKQVSDVFLDRMDIRPKKGLAKLLFQPGDWEVQVEGYTGTILSVSQRNADWIEKLHDGSIISDEFKLISMTILGIGLIFLSVSGFWLWFGPKLVKKHHH